MNKCEDLAQNPTIEYEDIFSSSLIKQVDAIRLTCTIWKIRESLTNKED